MPTYRIKIVLPFVFEIDANSASDAEKEAVKKMERKFGAFCDTEIRCVDRLPSNHV